MESLFQAYMERVNKTYLRGGSEFLSLRLYKTFEMNGCSYSIRIKQNSSLVALASDKDEDLYKAIKEDQINYAVTYGEFMCQVDSWEYLRRLVLKIAKLYDQLTHMYTFIIANMDMELYQIIQFYCSLCRMETLSRKATEDLTLLLSSAVFSK